MTQSINNSKLTAHVSLALKSFNVTVAELKSQTVLGHLQSVYKKRKYYFYIINKVTRQEVFGIKFKATIDWCEKNNVNFIIVAKSWEPEFNDFVTHNDYLWKIIPMDQLTKMGIEYINLKEKESNSKAS